MPPPTRTAVVAEGRGWLGTPYHHRGRLKGIGVDCAQFPVLVYSACGLFPAFDPGDYPPDWHLHRSEERYLNRAASLARAITDAEVLPGDFVLFRVGRCYAHGAIVTEWPLIVHAVVGLAVIEDRADAGRLADAQRKFFSPWG